MSISKDTVSLELLIGEEINTTKRNMAGNIYMNDRMVPTRKRFH